MDAAREERLERLFEAALARPPQQRAAFLEESCGSDASLRTELQRLLAHADEAEGFLDQVAAAAVARAAGALADTSRGADTGRASLVGRHVGHFEILEELGRGGMGVVYKARDTRLGRRVVLKFLAPHESADAEARQRFEQEARAASVLDHPNIAAVYEIGEAETGQLFIAMAYCEGETLKQKIARGALPLEEALDYAMQMAQALRAAHAQGIVHRDVKPSNVVVTRRGEVKLVDFGLAKMADVELTRTGVRLGTAAYMSPEQVRGEAVDPRTDLWSLGVVLYEMLTGRRPFGGGTSEAVLYGIVNERPEPVRALRPEVPEALGRVVEKLLQKDPAARYRQAEEVLKELQQLRGTSDTPSSGGRRLALSRKLSLGMAAVAMMVLLLGSLGVFLWQRDDPGGAAETVPAAAVGATPSVAVLPLQNYSGDPAQEYFVDGMTEELITTLTKVEGLRVIAHRSVRPFKHTEHTVPEIARLLEVQYVVDGSVVQQGDRVRITATLIDAEQNAPVWGERFERRRSDVLALQREVALAIARAVEVELTPQDRARLAVTDEVDPEAFALYLRGTQARYQISEEAFREAASYFAAAIVRDSGFAPAYAGLASVHAFLGEEVRARELVEKALALDPRLAEAYIALGMIRQFYHWDWSGAEEAFRQAIRLNPGHAEAHHELSMLLMRLKRFEEALEEARRAFYLAPTSTRFESGVGEVYLYSGRYDEAMAVAERAIARDSSHVGPYTIRGIIYTLRGDYEAAVETWQQCVPLGCLDYYPQEVAYVHALAGRRAEARRILEDLIARWRRERGSALEYSIAFGIARVYTGLGDHDQALDWLERAVSTGSFCVYLGIEPAFQPLRDEPRYRALLEKMGLPL